MAMKEDDDLQPQRKRQCCGRRKQSLPQVLQACATAVTFRDDRCTINFKMPTVTNYRYGEKHRRNCAYR